MTSEANTDGVPWRIPQVVDGEAAVVEDKPNRWHAIGISHETRTELVKGTSDQLQDIPVTVVLMARDDGEMKTWEARGNWTLEQVQAMPEAK